MIEISGEPLASMMDQTFLEYARNQIAAARYIPTLEEVRQMTSKDRSSWADTIIAERDERF